MTKTFLAGILLCIAGSGYAQYDPRVCKDANPTWYVKGCKERDRIINECVMSSADKTHSQCVEESREAVRAALNPSAAELEESRKKIEEEDAIAARKQEERENRLKELESRLSDLAANAYIDCPTTKRCDKAFALTEVYINQSSDMKIQLATRTTIETYRPTKDGMVAVKSVKIPRKGDSSRISLSVECQEGKFYRGTCLLKMTEIYSGFRKFIERNLE
ncbi:MAG: hypothetical protein HYS18_12770 [Burkholderiales bacterium]|nr:hypothetical protein [Burkholderiales bacterium]